MVGVTRPKKSDTMPQRSRDKWTWLKKWVNASPTDRLRLLRSKKQLVALHKVYFSNNNREPSGTKKQLLSDVLGFDLKKDPKRRVML